MSGQIEMWKQRLSPEIAPSIGRDYFRQLASDAVRAQRTEEFELAAARRVRAVVGQIYDLALPWTFNSGMRLVDETLHAFRKPVISTRLPEVAVHSLLNDSPMTVVGDDEAMQIKLEPVLHSGTVDLGYQPAGFGERGPIKAYPVPYIDQLVRRLP